MRYFFLILSAVLLFSQQAFANTPDASNTPDNCDKVAQACLGAGYSEDNTANKRFWQDCMRPVVLGKSAAGVKIDPEIVKACRQEKIIELKNELKDLQGAM